jgi:RNA polymerase primary sigma factor
MSPGGGELSWWLEQIGRHSLLTPAEEISLATLVQAWQQHPAPVPAAIERRGRRAAGRMATANLRLVVVVAKKYARLAQSGDLLDLCQAGNLGLVKAVHRFDPTRGYKFSTYAYWWIRQGACRWLEEHSRTIRLPSSFSQRVAGAGRATHQLTSDLGREPTMAELAEALETTPEELSTTFSRSIRCTSLDAAFADDGGSLGEIIADPQAGDHDDRIEAMAHDERLAGLRQAMEYMPGRPRRLLEERWGLVTGNPRTIRSIAAEDGCTAARISLELRRAESALRMRLQMQGEEPNPLSSLAIPWPARPTEPVVGDQLHLPGMAGL